MAGSGLGQALQFFPHIDEPEISGVTPGHEGYIGMRRQFPNCQSKPLPKVALQGIALHGTTHFSTDRQAKTARTVRPGQKINDEMSGINFPTTLP